MLSVKEVCPPWATVRKGQVSAGNAQSCPAARDPLNVLYKLVDLTEGYMYNLTIQATGMEANVVVCLEERQDSRYLQNQRRCVG